MHITQNLHSIMSFEFHGRTHLIWAWHWKMGNFAQQFFPKWKHEQKIISKIGNQSYITGGQPMWHLLFSGDH